MRKLIVLCAALVVITASVATAATTAYWRQAGNSYVCQGYAVGVICDDNKSPYAVSITKNYISLIGAQDRPIYFCARNYNKVCTTGR